MTTETENKIDQYLETYCARGWYIFPVLSCKKIPATKSGHLDASNDIAVIKKMFSGGEYNIGLNLEKSRLFAVDLDGDEGVANFLNILADGEIILPPTLRQKSPRGEHILFKAPAGFDPRGQLAEKIDLKFRGYIVLEPSVVSYETGESGTYKFINQHEIAEAPPELLTLCQKAKHEPPPQRTTFAAPVNGGEDRYYTVALSNLCNEISSTPNGARNRTLSISSLKVGTFIAAGGLDDRTARESLLAAALACGLPENESKKTIDSGIKKGMQTPHVKPDNGSTRSAGSGERPNNEPRPFDIASVKVFNMAELTPQAIDTLGKEKGGLRLGFRRLDNLLNGIGGGELILIASGTGNGKTSFLTQTIKNVAVENGQSTLLFTLEMTAPEITRRLVIQDSGLPLEALSNLYDHTSRKVSETMEHLTKSNIKIIDDGSLSIFQIVKTAEAIHKQGNLALIGLDYVQLIANYGSANTPRYMQVGEFARQLKVMAKKLNVPVIACAQLSRNAENGKDERAPRLSDLRESADLEQCADVVILLSRKDDKARFEIAKHRDGAKGVVDAIFRGETYTFLEY